MENETIERLTCIANTARDTAQRTREKENEIFKSTIHTLVDAVIRGEIDSIEISNFSNYVHFSLYNNGKCTDSAYGIGDVEQVIQQAIDSAKNTEEETEKTEEAE